MCTGVYVSRSQCRVCVCVCTQGDQRVRVPGAGVVIGSCLPKLGARNWSGLCNRNILNCGARSPVPKRTYSMLEGSSSSKVNIPDCYYPFKFLFET